MNDPSDVMLLFFFVITSLIGCNLTNRFQKQLIISHSNEMLSENLYQLSSRLLNVYTVDKILEEGAKFIEEKLSFQVKISFEPIETYKYVYEIQSSHKIIGYLYVLDQKNLSDADDMMLKAVCNQLSSALEREFTYQNQEKIKLAMEKEHMTNSLLRSISHDLRTPLTGIAGASSLIFERNIDSNINVLAKDIYEQAKWLSQLVENILNMSKIENDNLYLNLNYEIVGDLIQEAVSLRPELENRQLTIDLPDDLFFVNVDGKLIVQVLVNLLDNAIKYTSIQQKIEIKVVHDQSFATITIRDNGLGISESIKDKIFEEFITSPGVSLDSQKGIGLGLAICKAIVELHGGKIWADNHPEGGAYFSFTLPIESEVLISE